MPFALAIFAVIIILASGFATLFPSELLDYAVEFVQGPGLWWAAAMRLALAIVLWFSAPTSRTPITFKVLAVVALLAAVAIPIVGSERLVSVINWCASQPLGVVRVLTALGVAFGAFLLWSIRLVKSRPSSATP